MYCRTFKSSTGWTIKANMHLDTCWSVTAYKEFKWPQVFGFRLTLTSYVDEKKDQCEILMSKVGCNYTPSKSGSVEVVKRFYGDDKEVDASVWITNNVDRLWEKEYKRIGEKNVVNLALLNKPIETNADYVGWSLMNGKGGSALRAWTR